MAGQAAHQAARAASTELISIGADLLGWPEEHMSMQGLQIVRQDNGDQQPWSDLLLRLGRPIVGDGHVREPVPASVSSFTAQVAEVKVDPETGEVELLRFTSAHDAGKVRHPVDPQGQIDGAIIQGIGYALSEELVVEEGRVTSSTFGEYKIPSIKDIPELLTVVLESDAGPGPYNAKGIGESPCGAVAPAIANAVRDAVGARVRHLPITSEKVFQALVYGEGS